MVKTFCDCCDAYIPVVNSMNIWTLPSKQKVVIARGGKGLPKTLWEEEEVAARTYYLCDKCTEDMASILTILDRRKED